jgi:hypothetical protein
MPGQARLEASGIAKSRLCCCSFVLQLRGFTDEQYQSVRDLATRPGQLGSQLHSKIE